MVGRSFHEEGQPVRVLGVAMECTERERAQAARLEAEERKIKGPEPFDSGPFSWRGVRDL